MLRKALAIFLLLLFSSPLLAQAGPGHGVIEEPTKVNKPLLRKEIKRTTKVLKRKIKASRSLWQSQAIKKAWGEEKACLKATLDGLDPDGAITDLQTLYTISAVRAVSLHSIGPDGKTHTSFRQTRQRLRLLGKSLKTKALAQTIALKHSWMNSVDRLPRYPEGICPWLEKWQEAGSPDLASWAKLWRYPAIADLAAWEGGSYELYDLFYSLYRPRGEEEFAKMDAYISWFTKAKPYAEGYKTSVALWRDWLGENYPEDGEYRLLGQ